MTKDHQTAEAIQQQEGGHPQPINQEVQREFRKRSKLLINSYQYPQRDLRMYFPYKAQNRPLWKEAVKEQERIHGKKRYIFACQQIHLKSYQKTWRSFSKHGAKNTNTEKEEVKKYETQKINQEGQHPSKERMFRMPKDTAEIKKIQSWK